MQKTPPRNQHIKNNAGFTLVGVLMVLIILSVLGISIMAVASNSVKQSSSERSDQSTFYIAEAGVVETRKEIDEKAKQSYKEAYDETMAEYQRLSDKDKAKFDFNYVFKNNFYAKVLSNVLETTTVLNSFKESFSEQPSAEVTVTRLNSNPPEYEIKSRGAIGNKNRIVSQEIIVEWTENNEGGVTPNPPSPTPFPEGMGIFVKENITLDSAGNITGDIGTLKTGSGSITIQGGEPKINGLFYVPVGSEQNAIKKPDWMGGIPKTIGSEFGDFPSLPAFPIIPTNYQKIDGNSTINNYGGDGTTTVTLSDNASMAALNVGGSHKLTIDVGNTNKELVLDGLEVSGNAQVIIKGTGSLTLYIKNKFEISGSGKFNAQSPNKNVKILYSGLNMKIEGDTRIYASIYAQKANVNIGGSNAIYGSVLSGGTSFTVSGGGNVQPSLYVAPNAHFDIKSSGKVYGVIIGKSINVSGMGEVHYRKPIEDDWSIGFDSIKVDKPKDFEEINQEGTRYWGLQKDALIEE